MSDARVLEEVALGFVVNGMRRRVSLFLSAHDSTRLAWWSKVVGLTRC